MDEREENVDERRAGEQAMGGAEEGAKPPAVAVDREEDGVVGEREHLSEDEVEEVAERLGAGAVGGKRGAEQERQVHPGQLQLVRGPERGGEDEGAGEATGEGAPDAHRSASASARAALMRARWLSPCGMLPRNSPLAGSISSL